MHGRRPSHTAKPSSGHRFIHHQSQLQPGHAARALLSATPQIKTPIPAQHMYRQAPTRTIDPRTIIPPLSRRWPLTSRRPSPPAPRRGACLLCKTRRPSHPRSRNETPGSLPQKLLPPRLREGGLPGAMGRWAEICGHLYPSCCAVYSGSPRAPGAESISPQPKKNTCTHPPFRASTTVCPYLRYKQGV